MKSTESESNLTAEESAILTKKYTLGDIEYPAIFGNPLRDWQPIIFLQYNDLEDPLDDFDFEELLRNNLFVAS